MDIYVDVYLDQLSSEKFVRAATIWNALCINSVYGICGVKFIVILQAMQKFFYQCDQMNQHKLFEN